MKSFLAAFVVVCHLAVAAWPLAAAQAAQAPQSAVARVIVNERDAISMGSGVLVAVDGRYGMVVTNYHVVRDAAGPIAVVFPDGFRSYATLLKTDEIWDLAALAIQRPHVQPLPLAAEPPRPGEPLTIAGYGPDGAYRAVTGRCTQYLSPRERFPAELVEVDVQARHGDSGGPIYNSRGEVAGILFGAGGNFLTGGYTMGSYCGRVRPFLADSYVVFQQLPGNSAVVAQASKPLPPPPVTETIATNTVTIPVPEVAQSLPQPPRFGDGAASVDNSSPPRNSTVAQTRPISPASSRSPQRNPVAEVSPPAGSTPSSPRLGATEQIKTVLAVIGIIAILFHGLRLVASAVG